MNNFIKMPNTVDSIILLVLYGGFIVFLILD